MQINEYLNRVFGLMQSAKSKQALEMLDALPKNVMRLPAVLHIRGLVLFELLQHESALECLNASLMIDKKQPEVLKNLGVMYSKVARFDSAKSAFKLALQQKVDMASAYLGIADVYWTCDNYKKAVDILEEGCDKSSDYRAVAIKLAGFYVKLGRWIEAEGLYVKLLTQKPNAPVILHNLSMLYRRMDRLVEAENFINKAVKFEPNNQDLLNSRALILCDQERYDEAIDLFWAAIAISPSRRDLHKNLNEILWQTGKSNEFCKSYSYAIKSGGHSDSLKADELELLSAAKMHDIVSLKLAEIELSTNSVDLLRVKAGIIADTDMDGAVDCLMRAEKLSPTIGGLQQLVQLLLKQGDLKSAQAYMDSAFSLSRTNQLNWALQGTIWRQNDDDRYHWLNNYEEFIGVTKLSVPAGYINIEQFMDEVNHLLTPMHTFKNRPLMQTLKHGTQLPGNLLNRDLPVIKALKSIVLLGVEQYITDLRSDPNHPFLSKKSEKFWISGSWSVKLTSGGFHVNHVHPEGWISSSLYVKLPSTPLCTDSDKNEGCIGFGQSSMLLVEKDFVERFVQPSVGTMVLFPSYMWHGTVPFYGDDYRLTAPLDVVPV